MLVRVISSYFVAGVVVENNRIERAAPILQKSKDKVFSNYEFFKDIAKKRNWKIEELNENLNLTS